MGYFNEYSLSIEKISPKGLALLLWKQIFSERSSLNGILYNRSQSIHKHG